MSSVGFKTTSTEEKMSMYENMVEELVADENSRYILDGKLEACRLHFIIPNVLFHSLTSHKLFSFYFWCVACMWDSIFILISILATSRRKIENDIFNRGHIKIIFGPIINVKFWLMLMKECLLSGMISHQTNLNS